MAVDEAMFLTAETIGGPTLRFYRWQEPTLSLGYFQCSRDIPTSLQSLPMVRRLSGGGAIVHDKELTYSLVIPAGLWPRQAIHDLVRDVHAAIRRALPALQPAVADEPSVTPPFLCFERRSQQDLILGDSKIVGSAQRNRRGTVLQHGSILESRSIAVQHLAGLIDLKHTVLDEERIRAIVREVGDDWGWDFKSDPLSGKERLLAAELQRSKYASKEWNQSR